MGIFKGYSFVDSSSMPHDSDSIILAMNEGRPMAPRLMYEYARAAKELLKFDKPIIFKPMGGVAPEASLIVSDADFVDWLTEAMGGFAVPVQLKEYRGQKIPNDGYYIFKGYGEDSRKRDYDRT